MTDLEKYNQLFKELSLLPSSKTDELFQFSQQIHIQLIKELKLPTDNE
ncbi:hypothetical protein SynA15127_01706 [Synechococcus sp. A15-127]|nr:hypothetical protein SynA15127_01706 [Synechococcus sp. A15-127]